MLNKNIRRLTIPFANRAALSQYSSSSSSSSNRPPPCGSLSEPTIPHGSAHHSNLTSFLAHARSQSLSRSSTTYIGTLYEYVVQRSLAPLGFSLTRVGRTSDAGIDLQGTWDVPSHPSPLRVLVQCKYLGKSLGPMHVRELEGAMAGAHRGWRGEGTIGLLVGRVEASRGVLERVQSSDRALGFLQVDWDSPPESDKDLAADEVAHGRVRQFVWNWVAQEKGLAGLGMQIAHKPTKDGALERECVLTWNGKMIEPMPIVGEILQVDQTSSQEQQTPQSRRRKGTKTTGE